MATKLSVIGESQKEINLKNIAKDLRPEKTENLRDKWADVPSVPSITENEAKILTMLDERYGQAKDRHLRRIDVFNASYLQYRSISYYNKMFGLYPSYWSEWGTNVFIPRTFEVVEGARAQLKSQDPDFVVEPLPGFGITVSMADVVQSAKKATILAKGEWQRSHSGEEALEALDDAIIWGTGILRNDLIKETDSHEKPTFDKDGNIVFKTVAETTYFGVGSKRTHPYDFFPEPSPDATVVNGRPGRKEKGIRYAFVRSVVDVEDLRSHYQALFESGTHGVTDKYQFLTPGGDVADYKYLLNFIDDLYPARGDLRYPATLSDTQGNSAGYAFSAIDAYNSGKIELLEYFERNRYIVVANGLILRDSPNPYPHGLIPFSLVKLFNTKTFWSIGYPEVMKFLQLVENVLYEQGLNNIVMNVHKMFAVNERYLEDAGDLVVRPFGIIRLKSSMNVNVNDAIQPINFSPISNDYFNFLTINKGNIQTLTGQSEFTSGGVTKESKVERATVANRIVQGSSLRASQIIKSFESMVADAVEQQLKIAQFYYQKGFDGSIALDVAHEEGSQKGYARIYRDKTAKDEEKLDLGSIGSSPYLTFFSMEDIQGMYGVTVKAGTSSALSPEEKSAMKMQAAQWAASVVSPDGRPKYDISKMADDILQEVFMITDPTQYYASVTPAEQLPPGSEELAQQFPSIFGSESPIPAGGGEIPPQ